MENGPGEEKFLIDSLVPGTNQEDQLNHRKGMLQQAPEENVVDRFGRRGHFEFFDQLLIVKKSVQESAQKGLANLGSDILEFFEHFLNVLRSLGQIIPQLDFTVFAFPQPGNAKLLHPLEFIHFPPNFYEIVFFKQGEKIQSTIPDSSLCFPGPVCQLDGEVRISGLGFGQNLIPDQKDALHRLAFTQLVDKYLGHISSPRKMGEKPKGLSPFAAFSFYPSRFRSASAAFIPSRAELMMPPA
jgi:hypothetical protein